MKKLFSLFIVLSLLLGFTGCKNNEQNMENGSMPSTSVSGTNGSTSAPAETYPSFPELIPSETLTTGTTAPKPQKCVHAYDDNGICTKCGALKPTEGLAYRLNEDGASYSIAGIGNCYGITTMIIADTYNDLPVTAIADKAFYNVKTLTAVVIPQGILTVGDMAFSGCEGLTEIVLPAGMTTIGESAFSRCKNLKTLLLADGISEIKASAFTGCTALETITLPVGLHQLSATLFKDCTALRTVVIPKGVTQICEWAFYGCSSLDQLILPDGLLTIDSLAFSKCSSLMDISIPDSILHIDETAFNGCSLNYTTYSNAEYLGNAENPYVVLVQLNDPYVENFHIHENTKMLGTEALYGAQFDVISLPNGLTSIENRALTHCGFTYINIPDTVVYMGDGIFEGCYGLKQVTLPKGITRIGSRSFYECSSLQSITLPDGITRIDEYAFYKCENLTDIRFPASMDTMGAHAFERCEKLMNVTLNEGLLSIGTDAFRECYSLTSIHIPASVSYIRSGAFNFCTALTIVTFGSNTIQNNALEIEHSAFAHCENLMNFHLPAYVTSIGTEVFVGCKNLTGLSFAGTVEQWKQITLSASWNGDAPFEKVICSDSELFL